MVVIVFISHKKAQRNCLCSTYIYAISNQYIAIYIVRNGKIALAVYFELHR